MKKLSTLLFVSMVLILTSTYAQIPNFSFENWTNMGNYENPDQWGTMNNTTALASVFTVTKATPGNPGSFYMKITSKLVGNMVVNGIAVSGRLDSITQTPMSGFPYTQRPQSFTGRWQHMIYGSSQGSLRATLTRWDTQLGQRVTVATANQTLSGMAMSWANFTINFTYTDGGYPDTCIIVLKASGTNPTNNDYLWVDNLAFTGIVAGISDMTASSSLFSVYPVPSQGEFHVQFEPSQEYETLLEVSDLQGRVLSSTRLATGVSETKLDLSGFSKGTYLMHLRTGTLAEVKRVVIQ